VADAAKAKAPFFQCVDCSMATLQRTQEVGGWPLPPRVALSVSRAADEQVVQRTKCPRWARATVLSLALARATDLRVACVA